MSRKIEALLKGQGGNYILPFFWQHGESEEVLRKYMKVIREANIGAVCVESRPHPDFCGPQWWHDMDIILDEARNRNMKVWILDDSHFPTGFANGAMAEQPDERCRQSVTVQIRECAGGETLSFSREELSRAAEEQPTDIEKMISVRDGSQGQRIFEDDRLLGVFGVKLDANGFWDGSGCVDLGAEKYRGEDGGISFTPDEGVWKVYVLHLTRNRGPHRNYINMMDEASCRVLIDAVYEPHWEHYKDDFGKTIAGFFSDEPEIGNGHLYAQDAVLGKDSSMDYPWSAEVEKEMARRLGEDFVKYLPLLWENHGDKGLTAKVRFAYMDIVTRLVEKDFSFQLGDWCRAHGVEYIGHLIEDNNMHARTGSSLGHYFRGLAGQDMAGIDDIGGQVLPGQEEVDILGVPFGSRIGEFYHYMLGKLGNSLASLSPLKKGRAMCEIFGAYGWSEGVQLEKYLVDHFLVRGINRYVPHAFSPKEFPDPDCPPHFYAHGHNPQYRHFGKLMAYTNRVCELISDGVHVAPAAILYHGDAEWSGECMMSHKVAHVLCDHQIDYDFVPQDVFAEPEKWELSISEGTWKVHTQEYRVLLVPYMQFVRKDFAEAVGEMCGKGISVYFVGGYPEGICDLGAAEMELEAEQYKKTAGGEEWIGAEIADLEAEDRTRAEAADLEAELLLGMKKAGVLELDQIAEQMIQDEVAEIGITPADDRIRYYHYIHEDGTEIYLLVNEGEKSWTGTVSLKGLCGRQTCPGDQMSIYCYNAWENCLEKADWNGDSVSLVIEPRKSQILVLDAEGDSLSEEYYREEPSTEGRERSFAAAWIRSTCVSTAYPVFENPKEVSLPDHLAEEEPLFSGYVQYENRFSARKGESLVLEISDASEGVEVFANDQSLGIQIVAPYRYDLTNFVRDGENRISIQVATTLEREMSQVPNMFGEKPVPKCGSGITGEVRLIAR